MEPRQDPKAYKQAESLQAGCEWNPGPDLTWAPTLCGPRFLGHTLPRGYGRVSPGLTATPHVPSLQAPLGLEGKQLGLEPPKRVSRMVA